METKTRLKLAVFWSIISFVIFTVLLCFKMITGSEYTPLLATFTLPIIMLYTISKTYENTVQARADIAYSESCDKSKE